MALTALVVAISLAQAAPPADPPKKTDEERPRKLDLGPYGTPASGTPRVETITDLPRFESTIDVEAKGPSDLNQTMSLWWSHFNLTSASVYGYGTAFRAAPPNGSVDITPLVGWVSKKVSDYKRNHNKPPKASPSPGEEPSPSPTPGS